MPGMGMGMDPEASHIDAAVLGRVLAEQAPDRADLPLRRVGSTGTDNAIFRLGAGLALRLPHLRGAAAGDPGAKAAGVDVRSPRGGPDGAASQGHRGRGQPPAGRRAGRGERDGFGRDRGGGDEADWQRARGWALYGAVIALGFHRGGGDGALCRQSRRALSRLGVLR